MYVQPNTFMNRLWSSRDVHINQCWMLKVKTSLWNMCFFDIFIMSFILFLLDIYFFCRIEFEAAEVVTCLKVVNLTCEGSMTGKKGFIAVSTTDIYTEDLQSRGSVRGILDLVWVWEGWHVISREFMSVILFSQQLKHTLNIQCLSMLVKGKNCII